MTIHRWKNFSGIIVSLANPSRISSWVFLSRCFVFACFFLNGCDLSAQQSTNLQPHVPRQSPNLFSNSSLMGTSGWALARGATIDRASSRMVDGSGSIKLPNAAPGSSTATSHLINVEPGKLYTFGFHFKVTNGPTYVGAQISLRDANGKFIRNDASTIGGTTGDHVWQEFALPFVVPAGVTKIKCSVYKADNTRPNGTVWADDFYIGQGIGLEQPPAAKRPFEGGHVRVDELGNFEINKRGVWTPFFPLCIYSDNYRDLSVYSNQGWNTIIWTSDADQIKDAQDATSEFNPDGMMAGFQISQYTAPGGSSYHALDRLKEKVNEIYQRRLDKNLLMYYWDNENHHEQWQAPGEVISVIKRIDTDQFGRRHHPVYALQSMFNNARVHAACGMVDISGAYFDGNADSLDSDLAGHERFFVLNHLERQNSPSPFAQFNGVNGAGDMRLRIYNSLSKGAKAIGYWRDCFQACNKNFMEVVGPVDQKDWWPDFPNLRREVDFLLPLIRQPHWTNWSVSHSGSGKIQIGTRDLSGVAHLILVNQTTLAQTVTITTHGLAYQPTEVQNCFDGQTLCPINNRSFTVTIPGIGIGSGTSVLRLVTMPR